MSTYNWLSGETTALPNSADGSIDPKINDVLQNIGNFVSADYNSNSVQPVSFKSSLSKSKIQNRARYGKFTKSQISQETNTTKKAQNDLPRYTTELDVSLFKRKTDKTKQGNTTSRNTLKDTKINANNDASIEIKDQELVTTRKNFTKSLNKDAISTPKSLSSGSMDDFNKIGKINVAPQQSKGDPNRSARSDISASTNSSRDSRRSLSARGSPRTSKIFDNRESIKLKMYTYDDALVTDKRFNEGLKSSRVKTTNVQKEIKKTPVSIPSSAIPTISSRKSINLSDSAIKRKSKRKSSKNSSLDSQEISETESNLTNRTEPFQKESSFNTPQNVQTKQQYTQVKPEEPISPSPKPIKSNKIEFIENNELELDLKSDLSINDQLNTTQPNPPPVSLRSFRPVVENNRNFVIDDAKTEVSEDNNFHFFDKSNEEPNFNFLHENEIQLEGKFGEVKQDSSLKENDEVQTNVSDNLDEFKDNLLDRFFNTPETKIDEVANTQNGEEKEKKKKKKSKKIKKKEDEIEEIKVESTDQTSSRANDDDTLSKFFSDTSLPVNEVDNKKNVFGTVDIKKPVIQIIDDNESDFVPPFKLDLNNPLSLFGNKGNTVFDKILNEEKSDGLSIKTVESSEDSKRDIRKFVAKTFEKDEKDVEDDDEIGQQLWQNNNSPDDDENEDTLKKTDTENETSIEIKDKQMSNSTGGSKSEVNGILKKTSTNDETEFETKKKPPSNNNSIDSSNSDANKSGKTNSENEELEIQNEMYRKVIKTQPSTKSLTPTLSTTTPRKTSLRHSTDTARSSVKKSVQFFEDPKRGFVPQEVPEWMENLREPHSLSSSLANRPPWTIETPKNVYSSLIRRSQQPTYNKYNSEDEEEEETVNYFNTQYTTFSDTSKTVSS